MVALPQYSQEVQSPDLRIVPKTEKSGRMTNTSYGVFFIDEARNGFQISIMFNEDRGPEGAYREVVIPYSVIAQSDISMLRQLLRFEPFARQIISEKGVDALSGESLYTKNFGSVES